MFLLLRIFLVVELTPFASFFLQHLFARGKALFGFLLFDHNSYKIIDLLLVSTIIEKINVGKTLNSDLLCMG